MKNSFLFYLLISSIAAHAQNPLAKQWDYRFGGTGSDYLYSFVQSVEGGYLLGGMSNSGINGDKTQAGWGSADYWIIKVDVTGNKEWDKRFGGTNSDVLNCLSQCLDGGFILGGTSYSDSSGDKTQHSWSALSDFWIVKIDSVGNIQWDKRFGGIGQDELYSLEETRDGGFILGGWSESDSTGDKTQYGRGGRDYWVVKIDSVGNKQFDRRFGGVEYDLLSTVHQCKDGGFILAGISQSGIGGDKTNANWDATLASFDFWIVKIDSIGNKLWDKVIGGTNGEGSCSLSITSDQGFIIGGNSFSGIGGDRTVPSWGSSDYWIVKLDSSGNYTWDRKFGGTDEDGDVGSISLTSDSGYLICGTSYSAISGDKTENNLGQEQIWIVKIDSVGSKQWDKTIFTLSHDEICYGLQSKDGCFVFANWNQAGIGGYKSQNNWGDVDYWIVKFCDSTQVPISAFTTATPICPGTCTNFINLSTNATSYLWSFPGASPNTSTYINPTGICYNTPGTYDVTLIAINANGSDTLTLTNYITVFPYPAAQGIQQSGDTLIANQGAVSYQWYFNGSIISAATNYFYVAQASGDYNVVATDANGCEVEAVIFSVVAGITHKDLIVKRVLINPNPISQSTRISFSLSQPENLNISAVDITGRLIENLFTGNMSSGSHELTWDVLRENRIDEGVYFLNIIGAGFSNVSKIIVVK